MAKITKKNISEYINEFKRNVLIELNVLKQSPSPDGIEQLQKYICDYAELNVVEKAPIEPYKKKINLQKCWGKLETGAQCKRKHYLNNTFCKNHLNNTPFGLITESGSCENKNTVMLYIQDIRGIQYYVDENKNVYDSESILSPNLEPKIIGTINSICDNF